MGGYCHNPLLQCTLVSLQKNIAAIFEHILTYLFDRAPRIILDAVEHRPLIPVWTYVQCPRYLAKVFCRGAFLTVVHLKPFEHWGRQGSVRIVTVVT